MDFIDPTGICAPLSPVMGDDAYTGDASPADAAAYVDWAHRAAAAGRVATTSPLIDVRCVREVCLDSSSTPEDPDHSGVVLLFTDDDGEVHDLDFDFGDKAYRHLMHDDGRGVTLCGADGIAWVHYRILEAG